MNGLYELILGYLELFFFFYLIRFKGISDPVFTDEEDTESLWHTVTKNYLNYNL